jgi:hypothetical protein
MATATYYDCFVESLRPALIKSGMSEADTKKICEAIVRETWSAHERKAAAGSSITNQDEALRKLLDATALSAKDAGIPETALKRNGSSKKAKKEAAPPPVPQVSVKEVLAKEKLKAKEQDLYKEIKAEQFRALVPYETGAITTENYSSLTLKVIQGTPFLFSITTKFTAPDSSRVHRGEMMVNGQKMLGEEGGKAFCLLKDDGNYDQEWLDASTGDGKAYVRTLFAIDGLKLKTYCGRDGASNANVPSRFYVVRGKELVEINEADYKAAPCLGLTPSAY